MATRTIYLLTWRSFSSQRAHFSIFVPSAADQKGTLIHVIGTPMTGYSLEFRRNFSLTTPPRHQCMLPIGKTDACNISDPVHATETTDSSPRGKIEIAASQVPAPGINENFMAPVNDTTNKRCQEWTMEFIRYLVTQKLIEAEAVQIVQSQRDPPDHCTGLRPIRRA
ncbi:unnamed protein product [Penicillium olsonii]|uniref:Uncharacterized protein n=1 Tax=Penicillium olsonii TaxID=99116 RepID=A0A9W4I4W8_PENOL|nr:unnamed protein product [Penicillium olsonii]CAG8223165.1 unnamed protein product [Penicillium olsonii]